MNDQHTLLLRELQSLRGIVAKNASHEQENQGGGGKKAKKAKEMQGEAKEMQGEAKEKQGAKEKPGEPKKKKVSTPPDETQVDVGEEMETIEDDSELPRLLDSRNLLNGAPVDLVYPLTLLRNGLGNQ